MRILTTTLSALTVLVLAGLLSGCNKDNADTTPIPEEASLTDHMKLRPNLRGVTEGEIVSYRVDHPDGTWEVFSYEVRGGVPTPLYGAPPFPTDAQQLGAIWVEQGAPGDGEVNVTERPRSIAAAQDVEWEGREAEVNVPEIFVDHQRYIPTERYVEDLQAKGRTVSAAVQPSTGPSLATEFTKIRVDDKSRAEVYQFNDPTKLEMWYRVQYQLYTDAGMDPEQHIEINGLTMLLTGEETDQQVRQAFLDAHPRQFAQ